MENFSLVFVSRVEMLKLEMSNLGVLTSLEHDVHYVKQGLDVVTMAKFVNQTVSVLPRIILCHIVSELIFEMSQTRIHQTK